ncbi:MAG: transglycosylase domain-containing protein [Candidatus Dormiibacterota bacterium]
MSQWRPVGGEIRPGVSLKQVPDGPARGARRRGGAPKKPGWHGPFGWGKWRTLAAAAGALVLLLVIGIAALAATLPDPSQVQVHAGEVKIYDRTGQVLVADVQGGGEQRQQVSLDKIAPDLQHATVAAEDRNFYHHAGIDWPRLAKALTIDVISRSAQQGGSTITQQLAKNALLTSDRTVIRKVKEAILATEIEQRFTKDDILGLYLNSIYYGHHAYGIQAASQVYFGKDAKDLTLGQASFLAGLPQAPSSYDPDINYDGAKARQAYVLGQMVRENYITQDKSDAAQAEDLRPQLKKGNPQQATGPAPHFVAYVLGQLEADYGRDVIDAGGVTVTSTLDMKTQGAANTAVHDGIPKLSKFGVNNGAMLVSDPRTGDILAMVGSADFNNDGIAGQVNITTAKRQPGSSFKPYVYLTGLDNRKFDTTTVFNDSSGTLGKDTPKDFDNRYMGTMRMRQALDLSRNVPAEQAMQKAGPSDVVSMAKRVGITTTLQENLATAIGASEVTMVDHATGYGVLANQGTKNQPVAILKVQSGAGRDITLPRRPAEKVVDAAPTYIINDILKGYNKQWNLGFDRTLAAKSGTTNVGTSTGDGWLMAYNPDVVIATWAGHTSNNPSEGNATKGFFGVSLAQPIVDPFLKSMNDRWKSDFTKPGNVSTANCAQSGLSVFDPVQPELAVAGQEPSCAAPPASPVPAETPVTAPSANPSPTPSPSPSGGVIISPLPSGSPHP